jgi:hypothetical protein
LDLGVRNNADDTRRATRLLRWYPPVWRERYGEEFIDHLEQEFADRPVDLKRSINVAYKGVVARVADVGLASVTEGREDRTRAALGTSFALCALAAIVALNFWSRAMGLWSARTYHPIPVSATAGTLTVATAILVVVLVAMVLTIIYFAVRQLVRGRARPLLWPSIFAVGSGALLYYSVRWLPRLLEGYSHLRQGGLRWTHLGSTIYAFSEITWMLTQRWVDLWGQGGTSTPDLQDFVNDLVPLATLVFGVSIALLVRRVELPRFNARLGQAIVALLGSLIAVFVLTYLVWLTAGGPMGTDYFVPEGTQAGVIYLIFLGLIAALVVRSGLVVRGSETRQQRNHMEIRETKSDPT